MYIGRYQRGIARNILAILRFGENLTIFSHPYTVIFWLLSSCLIEQTLQLMNVIIIFFEKEKRMAKTLYLIMSQMAHCRLHE